MFNVGPAELLVIFLIALLVFGPNKLPEVGRQVGRAVREFRRFQESMRDEVRDVFEPVYGGEPPRLPPAGPAGEQGDASHTPAAAIPADAADDDHPDGIPDEHPQTPTPSGEGDDAVGERRAH